MNIFSKFRRWLIDKYLPAYVSAADRENIAVLGREVAKLSGELRNERAYSAGLEYALRHGTNITVKREG